MNHLADHYGLLLGLDSSWQVRSVELSLEENRVDILLEAAGGEVICPRCAKASRFKLSLLTLALEARCGAVGWAASGP